MVIERPDQWRDGICVQHCGHIQQHQSRCIDHGDRGIDHRSPASLCQRLPEVNHAHRGVTGGKLVHGVPGAVDLAEIHDEDPHSTGRVITQR